MAARLSSAIVVNFAIPGGTTVKSLPFKFNMPIGVVAGRLEMMDVIRSFPTLLPAQSMSTVPGYCVETAHVQVSSKVADGHAQANSGTFCNGVPPEHIALEKYFAYAVVFLIIHFSAPQAVALQSSGPAKTNKMLSVNNAFYIFN